MRSFVFVYTIAGVTTGAAGARVSSASTATTAAYEDFRQTYGRSLTEDGADAIGYQARLSLFAKRRKEVHEHNARPGSSWVAGLNRFADYTDAEFQMLLGHRPAPRERGGAMSFIETASAASFRHGHRQELAASVNWNQSLTTAASVKDQGGCGSCWAVAAVGALETHAELLSKVPGQPLSYEQLVDCVANPNECGGQGGCKGATSELAFGHVKAHGLAFQSEYQGYQTGGDMKCKPHGKTFVTSDGFERLPVNKLLPLLEAVTKGPVVVSADASPWALYSSGVFEGCDRDATVNHAILLVGYGFDEKLGKKFFLIRNSWGAGWGENGYIRLIRRDTDEGEAGMCGTDSKPLDGVGCKGGPAKLRVCGDCGILSDSAFPKNVRVVTADVAGHTSSDLDLHGIATHVPMP